MDKIFHQPLGGNEMPRFAGIATMMRLPHLQSAKGLDAAFIGVPLDIGTSLRAGTRFGPCCRGGSSPIRRGFRGVQSGCPGAARCRCPVARQ